MTQPVASIPRRLLAACAVLVSVSLAATGCGASSEPRSNESDASAVEPVAVSQEQLLTLPVADTFSKTPNAPRDPAPSSKTTGLLLRVKQEIPIYGAKGGEPVAKMPERQLGSPTWVPVINKDGDWYHVLLPSRPNGSTGWVYGGNGGVQEAQTPYRVVVDRESFRLTVFENGKEIGNWTVGIGKPETPTPAGRTFIMASMKESVTNYSPIILPLGMHSTSHTTFGGGPGTVGIHGWPNDKPFGKKSSDGCIRVPDDALKLLSTLPLGTIVLIK